MIFLNFKNYPESVGDGIWNLLEAGKSVVSDGLSTPVYFAPNQLQLLTSVEKYPELQFAAQHVDAVGLGSMTGWMPAEMLAQLEIGYAIYNHSEHRVWTDSVVEDVKLIQSTGVKLVVCCENLQEAETLLAADPYAIAYEIPELIGSGNSISTHQPDSVREFVSLVKGRSKALIGAGISNGNDVRAGLELGAEGFLLASAFVKSADPAQTLRDLLSGYSQRIE